MIISEEVHSYLSGDKFTNSLYFPISVPEKKVAYRVDYIVNRTRNQKVIHMGCADHIELIEKKIKQGSWLHSLLEENCENCLGVDIDEQAIRYIKKLGFKNTMVLDIVNDPPPSEINNTKWDYMVLGEILEHIDNPVAFLSEIHQKYSLFVGKLLISVPSALRLINFKKAFKHTELINSDHRYWFTPYTLAKVCILSGFKVDRFQMCKQSRLTRWSVINRFLLKRYPALRDTIVMEISF